jgi:hypothetical protein
VWTIRHDDTPIDFLKLVADLERHGFPDVTGFISGYPSAS